MPDMKSAMQAALFRAPNPVSPVVQQTIQEWDAQDKKEHSSMPLSTQQTKKFGRQITNNVTRVTFNYIKDNPGITKKQAIHNLESVGFKPASVTSLISQFLRSGIVVMGKSKNLQAVTPEYKFMPKPTSKVPKKTLAPEPLQNKKTGIAALALEPVFDPKAIVGPLTVYQARELYLELKAMFGN